MARLWIKIIPAVICLLLALLILPCGGNAYAQKESSIGIIEPANGTTISSPEFTVKITYSVPALEREDLVYGDIYVNLRLVALEGEAPGQGSRFEERRLYGENYQCRGSGTWTFSKNIDEWWSSKFETRNELAPAGEYELVTFIKRRSLAAETVATARSTFHYTTSNILPPVINFTVTPPSKQKAGDPADLVRAGEPVTLTWKVTGAQSVSIDQGVGSVSAEGSKPVTPTKATRSAVQSIWGDGTVTEVVTYTAAYVLKAIDGSGKAFEKTVTIKIKPKTIDEIFNDYKEWGINPPNKKYEWSDGTVDTQPLKSTYACGATVNLAEEAASVRGDTEIYADALRWDCNAMQYKSLVCLNELKKTGKLIGWDYMPVQGAVIARTYAYPVHQAVAIWPMGYGDSWRRTATILDPHDRQEPHMYSVTDGLDSMYPWEPQTAYGDSYPNIPGGNANGEYRLDRFDQNPNDRWENGGTTPWQNPETFVDKACKYVKSIITVHCPVDLLITNSTGQRLGKLSDGTMVAEFEPLDAYYWSNENGDKQWYYALADGTYKIEITGTDSGTFNLLTYSGGENINDYGESPIAAGQQATLSVQPGTVGELTLADGTKVTPEAKTIESFQTSASGGSEGLNLTLIIGIAAGVIVVLIIVLMFGRKKQSKN